MVSITIFGKGNMGQAIGGNFAETGNVVNYITTKNYETRSRRNYNFCCTLFSSL